MVIVKEDSKGISERIGKGVNKDKWLQIVYIAVLLLYPLRHINWGLDLWDTGYNYANFEYMGLEHMDPMWLFSTYLANAVGNFLTKLPLAGGLVGMNFYTGLFVSLLAVMGYFFCTKKLGMPRFIAFIGEFLAISLCWCPTALLYNYLTYVLFLVSVIFLYKGLTEQKKGCLFVAGICLGANVLVRFSNLPEAAMIVAVWAYGIVEWLERRAENRKNSEDRRESSNEKSCRTDSAWKTGLRRTLWCLGGYLTALAVLFVYIHLRYGMDAYVAGIQRLFAMTDNATDYKATSMLMGMVYSYLENMYWVIRMAAIVVAGIVFFGVVDFVTKRIGFFKTREKLTVGLSMAARVLWAAACVAMLGWLYYRGFCSFAFYSYDSIHRPGILFLMLSMFIALIRIFHKKSKKEEKLVSGMVILVILLTSLGSNNGVYPSLNNLFVAAPYTLWECWRFLRLKDWKMLLFPLKGVLAAFLLMCFVQSAAFGASFVFVEATGGREITATVDNNEVLRGVKMSPRRAEWMRTASDYVVQNDLSNKTVILFGQIPALSYYLQLPSAFNPWSDLRSYSLETMETDLQELSEKMEKLEPDYELAEAGDRTETELADMEIEPQNGMLRVQTTEGIWKVKATDITQEQIYQLIRPVIILEKDYALYLEGGRDALVETGLSEVSIDKLEENKEKLILLADFMEKHGYMRTFSNDKFVFWE